jgi:hypothetical protein
VYRYALGTALEAAAGSAGRTESISIAMRMRV